MPECSTSSPYTTEANPFGPNQAAANNSRRVRSAPTREAASEAGRTSTRVRMATIHPPKPMLTNSWGLSRAPNTSRAANLANSASISPNCSNASWAFGLSLAVMKPPAKAAR